LPGCLTDPVYPFGPDPNTCPLCSRIAWNWMSGTRASEKRPGLDAVFALGQRVAELLQVAELGLARSQSSQPH
jgi:hypothetical protein